MGSEWAHLTIKILIALICKIPLNSSQRLHSSSEVRNMHLTLLETPYNPYPFAVYNRNYFRPQSEQLGPFFGLFPNLFLAPPTTALPTTTTTTQKPPTEAPSVSITCRLSEKSDTSCSPCPSGTIGGVISSPGYPNDYSLSPADYDYATGGNEADCKYFFAAADGLKVKMTLSAGANIEYSSTLEFIEFHDEIAKSSLGEPNDYPTPAPLTYVSSDKEASLSFHFKDTVTCNPVCNWQVTFSGVQT